MKMNKLDKSVLKLWYIRAAIYSLALIGVPISLSVILITTGTIADVMIPILLTVGIPVLLALLIILILPFCAIKCMLGAMTTSELSLSRV